MPDYALTRREAMGRAAIAAAAITLPAVSQTANAAAGAGARGAARRVPSVHCLQPQDRWRPVEVLAGCSDAAFSPDGSMLACTTPGGVEVRRRGGGESRLVTPEGFRSAGTPWHPSGSNVVVTGPGGALGPAEAPFAARVDGSGMTRLLGDLPGMSRAAVTSPDGRRVALTYVDGFVHRMLLADWEDGAEPRLVNPRELLPFDPFSEQSAARMIHGLSWHETRGFTPDGKRLVFSSDRSGGMANVNVYTLDLESGRVRHVTHDDGFTEGAAIDAGGTLLYGSTRAREPSFLTLVTGPQVPPFLGFAATPALHDALGRGHAPVGNGDVIAADGRTGLRVRLVVRRETLAGAAALGAPGPEHRIRVCSLSPDGREMAVAVHAGGREAVVICRRETAPAPVTPAATPVPPTAAPLARRGGLQLLPEEPVPVVRTIAGRYGGRAHLNLSGSLHSGSFEVRFDGFVDDGVAGFAGPVRFQSNDGGFSHEADVRRIRGSDAGEEDAASRGFYQAGVTIERPDTHGVMEGRSSRSGTLKAVTQGGVFRPQGRWTMGDEKPSGVPGSERCVRRKRRRRRRRRKKR